MRNYILTSSGFILPENKWFSPLSNTDDYKDSLLKKEGSIELFTKLDTLIGNGGINTSPRATEMFLNYSNQPSFDNFMAMVDMFTDILSTISLYELVKLQIVNPHISPTGFRLCLELLNPYKLHTSHREYAAVPTFFTMANKIDTSEMGRREELFNKTVGDSGNKVPANLTQIETLISCKEAFASVFKYIFTDFNRGSSHV